MQILVYILLAANLAAAGALVWRRCVSAEGVQIDHNLLFAAGFAAYWILPVLVGCLRLMTDMDGMPLWYSVFDGAQAESLAQFLGISLLFCLSFAAGSRAGSAATRTGDHIVDLWPFPGRYMTAFLLAGGALALAAGYAVRQDLFKGYLGGVTENMGPRGTFIATSSFLLAIAVLHAVKTECLAPVRPTFASLLKSRYFLVYSAVAVCVLSMGGRLYFVSCLLMLCVYRTVFFQRVRVRTLAVGGTFLVLVAAAIGIMRFGQSVSLQAIPFYILVEPLFTSFSLVAFIAAGRFDLINPPRFLMSDLTNLIPTQLLPGKAGLLLDPADFGYTIFSPLGALNSFVSFMINFGLLGSCLTIFCIGALLSWLKARSNVPVNRAVYVLTCGWIATSFFRDPFSVSLVKSIFEFSMVVPVGIAVVLHLAAQAFEPGRYGAAAIARNVTGAGEPA